MYQNTLKQSWENASYCRSLISSWTLKGVSCRRNKLKESMLCHAELDGRMRLPWQTREAVGFFVHKHILCCLVRIWKANAVSAFTFPFILPKNATPLFFLPEAEWKIISEMFSSYKNAFSSPGITCPQIQRRSRPVSLTAAHWAHVLFIRHRLQLLPKVVIEFQGQMKCSRKSEAKWTKSVLLHFESITWEHMCVKIGNMRCVER